MIRDIFTLARNPQLREQWTDTIVVYILEKYGNPPTVDAIVGPDTRRYLFAIYVSMHLKLPYIHIHKAGKLPRDPEDFIQETYVNRMNKVYL